MERFRSYRPVPQALFNRLRRQEETTQETAPDQRAEILLDDSFNNEVAKNFITRLREVGSQSPTTEIVIRINSTGGFIRSIQDMLAHLHQLENPVTTIAESRATSAAALLLASGDKGKRYAYEDATLMLHQSYWTMEGEVTMPQFIDYAKEKFRINRAFLKEVAKATSQPFKKIWEDTKTDFYLTPAQAVDYGLIDHVIPRRVKTPDKLLPQSTPTEIDFQVAALDETSPLTNIYASWILHK